MKALNCRDLSENMLELWIYAGFVGFILGAIFLFVMRKHILVRFISLIKKQKGAKVVYVFNSDKTIDQQICMPDNTGHFKLGNSGHNIDKSHVFYDRVNDCQAVVVIPTSQTTIDPYKDEKPQINPQYISMAIFNATLEGKRMAERNKENIKNYMYVIMGLCAFTLIISLINLNSLSGISAGVSTLATAAQQAVTAAGGSTIPPSI